MASKRKILDEQSLEPDPVPPHLFTLNKPVI